MPTVEIAIATLNDVATAAKEGPFSAYPPSAATVFTNGAGTADRSLVGASLWDVAITVARFFLTGQIPAGAAITSASLKPYVNTKFDQDGRNFVCEYYTYGGTISEGDYTSDAPGSPSAFSVTVASLTTGQRNTISLGNINNIPTTGYVGFRFHISGGQPNTGKNTIAFTGFSPGSPNNLILSITYSFVLKPDSLTIDGDPTDNQNITRPDQHRFGWTYHEGSTPMLPQAAFSLEWSTDNFATSPTVINGTTPNPYVDVAGNTFPLDTQVWWRVKTQDSQGNWGPYSDVRKFTARAAVTAPTVTAPSGAINNALPTITFTSSEGSREGYQAQIIKQSDSSIVYDSGFTSGLGTSQITNVQLSDATAYTARVRVRKSSVWSPYGTSNFTTAFVAPAAATAIPINAPGYNHIARSHPGTGEAVSSFDLYRKIQGESAFTRIKVAMSSSGYDDPDVPSNTPVEYLIRAIAATSAYTDGPASMISLPLEGLWLHATSDPVGTLLGLGGYTLDPDAGYGGDTEFDTVLRDYLGRTGSVAVSSPRKRKTFRVSFIIKDDETVIEGDRVISKWEKYLALIEGTAQLCLRLGDTGVIYYGRPRGNPFEKKFAYRTVTLELLITDRVSY
jgi:hypothetical protein